MGLFSSLFGRTQAVADQLAEVCLFVRQEMHFLEEYKAACRESSAALMRLDFSKDVLILLLSTAVVRAEISDSQREMEINEQVRSRYLSLIPVRETSLVGDCLVCEDELEAVGSFVAPGAPLPQVRTTIVATIGLISLVTDYRAHEFRTDFATGWSEQRFGWDLLLPVSRTFLSRIRGVSSESIDVDDTCELAIALLLPFHKLLTAKTFLR